MKFILLVLIFFCGTAYAFNIGDELYVLTQGGLTLRSAPLMNVENRILTVPFGTKIKVLGMQNSSNLVEYENIKGSFIKVQFQATNGYLFDGFLSALPAPEITNDLYQYLKNNVGILEEKDVKFHSSPRDPITMTSNYISCNRNIKYYYVYGDGGTLQKMLIPHISIYEGYLLSKLLFNIFIGNGYFPVSNVTVKYLQYRKGFPVKVHKVIKLTKDNSGSIIAIEYHDLSVYSRVPGLVNNIPSDCWIGGADSFLTIKKEPNGISITVIKAPI